MNLRGFGKKAILFSTAFLVLGCNTPRILVSQCRPFSFSQIRTAAVIPFYGNSTPCTEKVYYALMETFFWQFSQRGIQMLPVGLDVLSSISATGILSGSVAQKVGRLLNVDIFVIGSVTKCKPYQAGIRDGEVYITVKIYNGWTGEMLIQINGQMIMEYGGPNSISKTTAEIAKEMLKVLINQ